MTESFRIFRPDYPGRIIRPSRNLFLLTRCNNQYRARIFVKIRAGYSGLPGIPFASNMQTRRCRPGLLELSGPDNLVSLENHFVSHADIQMSGRTFGKIRAGLSGPADLEDGRGVHTRRCQAGLLE